MKRIYTFAMAAISTIAIISSCAKEMEVKLEPVSDGDNTETVEQTAEFNYVFGIGSESSDTKSSFNVTDKFVSWDASKDKLGVYSVNSSSQISYNQQCAVATSPSLSFTLKSKNALSAGDAIYAYYPYNYINTSTTEYRNPNNVHLEIKNAQAQDGTTFDSSVMPMVAKYAVTGDIDADTNTPVATMDFANLAGILKFRVYSSNATYRSESVISVTFKANSAICGEFNYDVSGLNYEDASSMTISGYTGTTITTTVKNPVALTDSKETAYDVCMAVAPGTYTGVVEVITDKAIYSYNVSSGKTVGRSQILSLGVNLGTGSRDSINPADYNWALVKDVKELAVGDWVIIAGSGYDVAMGTTQSDNYRPTVEIEKSGDALTATATTQIFEVANGSVDNTLAFKAVNGVTRSQYIYAASTSSNWLRSQASVDANASWLVTVTAAGVASLVAQGTNTKNTMQYNTGGWVAAYGSASQKALALYILDVPGEVKLRPSTLSVDFLSTDNSSVEKEVDFYIKNVSTWNVENSNTTDFTVDDAVVDTRNGLVTIVPKAVNNTYSDKTANVTVSASGADNVVISVTQAAKVAVLTPTSATTDIPATIADTYTITVNSNVPWTASPTTGAAYVDSYDVDGNTSSSPTAADGTIEILFNNNDGSAREIVFTITPNEVGCGLSAQTITFTQAGSVSTTLDNPSSVTLSSLFNVGLVASWANDANASSYNWLLSTEDDYNNVAPANTVASGTNATGATLTSNTWTLSKMDISPALSTSETYYFYVQAVGTGSYSSSGYARCAAGKIPVTLYTATFNVSNINTASPLGAGTYKNYYDSVKSITIGGVACDAFDICKNQANTPSGASAGTCIQVKNDGYIKSTAGKNIQSIVIRATSAPRIYLSSTSAGLASASAASYATGSSTTLSGASYTTYTITVPSGMQFFNLYPGATFRFYDMVVKYTTE